MFFVLVTTTIITQTKLIYISQNPDVLARNGSAECPQLAAQNGETLISFGVSKSFTVTGVNLPEGGPGMVCQINYSVVHFLLDHIARRTNNFHK